MEQIGLLLVVAGGLGLVLALKVWCRRGRPRALPQHFDFSRHKRFEHNR